VELSRALTAETGLNLKRGRATTVRVPTVSPPARAASHVIVDANSM
jgi:hypothetical protein